MCAIFFSVFGNVRWVMTGRVTLVGAGPGAADLLTVRAVRALGEADVILVDDLVDPEVMAYAPLRARRIRVGKRGGCRSTPQAFIQRLAWRYARQGARVVRLKGGDPFVFGRGGEEVEFLSARGIDVEVVPGITAGIAVPASLGIPVTHRDHVHGVTFVTAHTRDHQSPDWPALARTGTTLVVFMGLSRTASIRDGLLAGGMPASTPVAIVERGTTRAQREVITTLGQLPDAVARERIAAPALIVIGDVVACARVLAAGSLHRAAV
ncbi:MAG: uroporphyrinogen-III C-methyltransferase [Burkholderiales bacterium]